MSDLIYAAQHIPNSLAGVRPIAPPKRTHLTGAQRAINSTADFTAGPLNYRFSVPQDQVFKPRQSYFRLRVGITVKNDDDALVQQQESFTGVIVNVDANDEEKFNKIVNFHQTGPNGEDGDPSSLALAYNAPACLIKEFKVRLNDKLLSTTDNVPQIDTLCKRIQPRELQKTVTPYLEANYYARHKAISIPIDDEQKGAAGYEVLQLEQMSHHDPGVVGSKVLELIWQPSFGVWDQESLPPGDYEVQITQTRMAEVKNSFVQSLHDEGVQAEWDIAIKGFDLFYTLEQTNVETVAGTTFVLDMVEQEMHRRNLPGITGNSLALEVSSSLAGIAIAFQSNKSIGAEHPKYSRTLFTCPGAPEAGKDWVYPGDNLARLRNFKMKINKTNYPEESYALLEEEDGAYFPYSQMYVDNLIQTGAILSRTEAEGLDAFTQLGPYMYFDVALDGAVPPVNIKCDFDLKGADALDKWKALEPNALIFTRHRMLKVISYDAAGRVATVAGSDE